MVGARFTGVWSGIRFSGKALGAAGVLLHVCSSPAAAQQPASVTFTKDVAPIFQKSCQQCHMPGAIGPMALTTYEEARPWARAIKQKVVAGEMPPYRYDREIGIQKLQGDLRLSEADIQTISRWVDSGAPRGNPSDMPPPLKITDPAQWAFSEQFGAPDLVISTKPYNVPARGQDAWWKPVVPSGLTENRCIKAVAIKPSLKGRAAAHHANNDLMVLDEKTGQWTDGERLSEYALGKTGEIVPPDACRIFPANAMVRWDVHYYPSGEAIQNDVLEVGVWLYPKDHQGKYKQDLKFYYLQAKGGDLEIPPNGTIMTQGFHSFDTPVRIDSYQPHGHFRLVAQTLEIFYPETGKMEMISSISNWTNSWHTSHIYDKDAAPLVPKGAVLVITGYHDNTSANKQNPDPDQWVGPGNRTVDEMSHAWIAATHLDEEGYQRLVAEREARKKTQTQDQQQQQ